MYKTQNAVLDDDGVLHSDGTAGIVLSGTVQALKGDYSVILHYNMKNKAECSGILNIDENEQILSSVDLDPLKTEAILGDISIKETKILNISIKISEGTFIDIESIEYKRK